MDAPLRGPPDRALVGLPPGRGPPPLAAGRGARSSPPLNERRPTGRLGRSPLPPSRPSRSRERSPPRTGRSPSPDRAPSGRRTPGRTGPERSALPRVSPTLASDGRRSVRLPVLPGRSPSGRLGLSSRSTRYVPPLFRSGRGAPGRGAPDRGAPLRGTPDRGATSRSLPERPPLPAPPVPAAPPRELARELPRPTSGARSRSDGARSEREAGRRSRSGCGIGATSLPARLWSEPNSPKAGVQTSGSERTKPAKAENDEQPGPMVRVVRAMNSATTYSPRGSTPKYHRPWQS